jgi:hypothetical protein
LSSSSEGYPLEATMAHLRGSSLAIPKIPTKPWNFSRALAVPRHCWIEPSVDLPVFFGPPGCSLYRDSPVAQITAAFQVSLDCVTGKDAIPALPLAVAIDRAIALIIWLSFA